MLSLLPTDTPADLPTLLASLKLIAPLVDAMPDVVFFIKDTDARYSLANRTLAERCGHGEPDALIGLTAEQVFPTGFGAQYTDQDRRVLSQGLRLQDQLELHLYPGRQPGWCMTHKLALRDPEGMIIGMAGVSIDLQAPAANNPAYLKLAAVDDVSGPCSLIVVRRRSRLYLNMSYGVARCSVQRLSQTMRSPGCH